MSEGFGARLRRRREEQQIALGTIAEQTKIKQSLLEALEREDISHWPTGIFRRAFVRAYAHAINLDPDEVVRQFVETFPEPVEVVTTAALAAAADQVRGSAPPNRLRSLISSAVGSFSRRQRPETGTDTSIAPRRDESADELIDPVDVEPVDHERYLPRGLSQMENALDLISAAGRSHVQPEPDLDLVALAELCSEFARVEDPNDVRPLLRHAGTIVNAIGVVVWVWDPVMEELRPAITAGYADALVAQLPNVRKDADNVTAMAFRSGQASSIEGDGQVCALAVPLLVPAGCAGSVSFELHGTSPGQAVRAAATIVAAQLSQLIGGSQAVGVELPSLAVSHSRLAC
jgi:transcriptional regulator with XRE-family HTH domain